MVILDSNIIINHLRLAGNEPSVLTQINQQASSAFALSVISLQELYEGKSSSKEKEEIRLLHTIAPLRILPYNQEVALLAGKIARDHYKRISFADAAIAATAIAHQAQLLTLNQKDFVDIKNLELFQLKKP